MIEMLKEEEIYTELFEIWRGRIKSKRYTHEAFCFERNAGLEIMRESHELANLTWHNHGFVKFQIHHPDREINAPVYADRLAEVWLVERYIKPFVQPKLLAANMACQEGKGSKKTMMMLKQALARCYQKHGYDFYFLQFDMQGYYDNLSHEILKRQFESLTWNGYKLVCNCIDSWHFDDGYAVAETGLPGEKFGVPKGCLTSQWFGIYYLNELDHLIAKMPECLFYIRYMDDAVMFFKKKEECRRVKELIENYLFVNRMGIHMHPKKTNYAPISRTINFCGWNYRIKESGKVLVHIKQSKKKEMLARLKYIQNCYEKGEISWREARSRIHGACKYLEWGDTYHLRKYITSRFAFQRKNQEELFFPETVFQSAEDYYNDFFRFYKEGF